MTMDPMTDQPAGRAVTASRPAVVVLVVGLVVLAVSAWVGVYTTWGHRLDNMLTGFLARPGEEHETWFSSLMTADLCLLALMVAGCLWSSARRKQWRLIALSGLVALGALSTTEVLKLSVFERPGWSRGLNGLNGLNGLPSGHTTTALSLVMVALLLSPDRWRRRIVVAGVAGVTVMSAVLVTARWHRSSDIIAACGVVAAWAGLAVLLDRWTTVGDHRQRQGGVGPRDETWQLMVVAGAVGVLLVLLAGARPTGGWWGLVPALFVMELVALVGGVTVSLMAWATAGPRGPSTAP